jgi:hypothetical protein
MGSLWQLFPNIHAALGSSHENIALMLLFPAFIQNSTRTGCGGFDIP